MNIFEGEIAVTERTETPTMALLGLLISLNTFGTIHS